MGILALYWPWGPYKRPVGNGARLEHGNIHAILRREGKYWMKSWWDSEESNLLDLLGRHCCCWWHSAAALGKGSTVAQVTGLASLCSLWSPICGYQPELQGKSWPRGTGVNQKARNLKCFPVLSYLATVTGWENHRVLWAGRGLQAHLVLTPHHGQGHLP